MIAGAAALCLVFPPAAAILAIIGTIAAGEKIVKGAEHDNWKPVSEGTLNLGLCVIEFRGAASEVKTRGAKFNLSCTRTAMAEAKDGCDQFQTQI